MFLIIGLGNPGNEYQNNRHNVGHLFIDFLNQNLKHNAFQTTKTQEFMNNSGKEVRKIISQSPNLLISNIFIVHDDLDLRLGNFKIQKGVGPKVHNGIESIENALGTADFWRVRIGIDNRAGDHRGSGENYVLSDFTKDEIAIIKETFPKILKRFKDLIISAHNPKA